MAKKSLFAITILILMMTAATIAQPAQKRTRTKATGIWGMETDFSSVGLRGRNSSRSNTKTRPRQSKGQVRPKEIGGGAAGGALIGGAVAKTKTPHRMRKP